MRSWPAKSTGPDRGGVHVAAEAHDGLVVDGVMRVVVGEDHGVEHRHVDVLAPAGPIADPQRGEHRDRAVQPAVGIGDRQHRIGGPRVVEFGLTLQQAGLGVHHRRVRGAM